jgi:hypothetical protein
LCADGARRLRRPRSAGRPGGREPCDLTRLSSSSASRVVLHQHVLQPHRLAGDEVKEAIMLCSSTADVTTALSYRNTVVLSGTLRTALSTTAQRQFEAKVVGQRSRSP